MFLHYVLLIEGYDVLCFYFLEIVQGMRVAAYKPRGKGNKDHIRDTWYKLIT